MASQSPEPSLSDSIPYSSDLAKALLDNGHSPTTAVLSKAEALRWAVLFRHVQLVQQLVSEGADVDATHEETGETSLHMAAQVDECDILAILIEAGATLTQECKFGYTALHYAVMNQRIDAAKILVSNGCDVSYQSGVGCSPLHIAASRGHCEVVSALQGMGADIAARDTAGSTPLHHACWDGQLETLRTLVQLGSDVACRNDQGLTPLHMAVLGGHPEIVQELIASGADMEAQDNCGDDAPLQLAAIYNKRPVVDILLEHDVNLEQKNHKGCTALLHASNNGHVELVQLLREKGADINTVDHDGNSALHHAAAHTQKDVMQFLIQNGADIEVQNLRGSTPLLAAAIHGSVTSVRFLAEHGANIMASMDGLTALHHAAKDGYKILVRRLVEWGLDIELKTSDGQTALSIAAEWGHSNVVSLLLDCGADLDTVDHRDWRPLHFAAYHDREDVVEMLLEYGADPSAKDIDGRLAQDLAREMKQESTLKLLEDKTSSGQMPPKAQSVALLVAAAEKGNLHQVRQLLDNGTSVDSMDLDGRRAVSLAAENGKVSVMELLIDRKANVRLSDRNGESALWWASRYGHMEIVQQLLTQPIHVDAPDCDGQSPLSVASQKGNTDIVQLLLQSGSDPNSSVAYGKTALLFAANAGHLEIAGLLLLYNADVNYKSPKGDTALSLAERNEDEKMAEMIRSHVARSQLTKEQSYANNLLEAAESGRVAALLRLIRTGAKVDGIDGERVPIHQAAFAGRINCVKALIDCGADVNRGDMRNQTALGYAASAGHASIVELLRENEANIENQDRDQQTPLGRAAEEGHLDIVKLLLGFGAEIEAKDSMGRTPLCHAIGGGHKAIVKLLVERGADINSNDESGGSPLLFAVQEKNLDLTKLLMENGAEMKPNEINGRSPLSIAAGIGADSIVELFIDHGEDLNHSSNDKGTPIHFATIRGHTMIVNMLIEAGANINAKNDRGRNASSYAKEYGHESIVALLSRASTIRQRKETAARRREAEGLNKKKLYQHQPLAGDGFIRIIELRPGKPGDIISFELIQIRIEQSSTFEALSYEWKDKVGTIPVQCNNDRLLVTPNCKAAMERLRGDSEMRYLWIDSICINQEDKEELNQQVALMTEIYSSAHAVLLWLGEEESEALRLTFTSIPAMADIYETLYGVAGESYFDQFTSNKFKEARRNASVMMEYMDVADCFADLYFRSYFTRAWIFQEIILAGSRGIVMCGPYKTSWKLFKGALSAYSAYAQTYNPCFGQISLIDDKFAQDGTVSLIDATSALLSFQASDPRDKIFATLRLSSTKISLFKKPIIDYKATVQEVFVNATRHFIVYLARPVVWGWLCRPASKTIPGLPSWVPDFVSHNELLSKSPFEAATCHFPDMIDGVPSTTTVALFINGCVLDRVAFKLTITNNMSIQEIVKSVTRALDKQERGMYDGYAISNEAVSDDAPADANAKKRKEKGGKSKKAGPKKGHRRVSSKARVREYPQSTNGHAILRTILKSYGASKEDDLESASFLAWELSRDDVAQNSYTHTPEYLKRAVEFWEGLSKERDDFDMAICQKMESQLRFDRDLVLTEKGYFGLTEKDGAEEGMVVALVGGGQELSLLREETDGKDRWHTFCAHFFMSHLTEEIEKLEQIDCNARIERLEIR